MDVRPESAGSSRSHFPSILFQFAAKANVCEGDGCWWFFDLFVLVGTGIRCSLILIASRHEEGGSSFMVASYMPIYCTSIDTRK